jgi:hypothetical protein
LQRVDHRTAFAGAGNHHHQAVRVDPALRVITGLLGIDHDGRKGAMHLKSGSAIKQEV